MTTRPLAPTGRTYRLARTRFGAIRRNGRRLRGARFEVSWCIPAEGSGAVREPLEHLQRCALELRDRLSRERDGIVVSDTAFCLHLCRLLDVPGSIVHLDSTGDRGALARAGRPAEHWRRFRFEAAHRLPHVPDGHRCGRMHGHGYEIGLYGTRNVETDEEELERHWEPLRRRLDYANLNAVEGLENPTSEHLAAWIWRQLRPEWPGLATVSVRETDASGCRYGGRLHAAWKEIAFQAALRRADVPPGDPRRRLHGHGYRLRLHLCAPLAEPAGWVMDFGEIKERFQPVRTALDHRDLSGVAELEGTSPFALLQWLRRRAVATLPQLQRIDLFETPDRGAILDWSGERAPFFPA